MIETVLIGLAIFAVVRASPGPAVLAVVSTAMARGFVAAVPLMLGLYLTLSVWGVIAAAGLGVVRAAAPGALAMGLTVSICLAYAFLFSRGPIRFADARLRKWLDNAASALFAFAGIGLIRDGFLNLARRG